MTDTATIGTELADLLREHVYEYDRYVTMYPESMPTEAQRFDNSDEFIREARRYGHFFDEATLRTFKTRVYDLVDGRFLILSDKFDNFPRHYRVAFIYQHKPTCNNTQHIHKSVERLETQFQTLAAARRVALLLARLVG